VIEVSGPPQQLTFGLIHGSWVGPESLFPTRDALHELGHRAIVVEGLPTLDPRATSEDHARVAARQLSGQRLDMLMAHSGGAQLAPEVINLLGAKNIGHFLAVSGSFGDPSPDTPTDALLATIPRQRNSGGFRDAIITLPDGTTIFNPTEARGFFFNDLPRDLGELAVGRMHRGYRLADRALPSKLDVPATYALGDMDMVRDHDWALAIARALGWGFVKMNGGHSLPYTRPRELARVMVGLATQSSSPTQHIPSQRRDTTADQRQTR